MPDEKLQPIYTGSRALIVGINDYADKAFPPLSNAEADASSLAKVLQGNPYEFRVTTLIGNDATQTNINEALTDLHQADIDERIIVCFACHGFTVRDVHGNETGYIATYDTVKDKYFTALRFNDITELTRHSSAKHILFIFDSCFSGYALQFTRAVATTGSDEYKIRRAYQAIAAGTEKELAVDQGSISSQIVKHLSAKEFDQYGLITATSLAYHLRELFKLDRQKHQLPQFGSLPQSGGGEFIFLEDDKMPTGLLKRLSSPMAPHRLEALVEAGKFLRRSPSKARNAVEERVRSMQRYDNNYSVKVVAAALLDLQPEGFCKNIEKRLHYEIDFERLIRDDSYSYDIDFLESYILHEEETGDYDPGPEGDIRPESISNISLDGIEEVTDIELKVSSNEDDHFKARYRCDFWAGLNYDIEYSDGTTRKTWGVVPLWADIAVDVDCKRERFSTLSVYNVFHFEEDHDAWLIDF